MLKVAYSAQSYTSYRDGFAGQNVIDAQKIKKTVDGQIKNTTLHNKNTAHK